MLDIAALPIAMALTLWDALPVFLCVAAAAAIVVRAILTGQSLHTAWRFREIVALEGLAFSLLFYPLLAPVLLASAIATGLASGSTASNVPATPPAAARERVGEVVFPLLIAAGVASVIKVGAPLLPDSLPVQLLVALVAGGLAGHRSGVAIVPAIAIAVHLGGIAPATLCIAAGTVRHVVQERRGVDQLNADTA